MNHRPKPSVADIVTGKTGSQVLHIDGPLPTLNEYIRTERSHRMAAAKMKRDAEAFIAHWIWVAKLKPVTHPVRLFYCWQLNSHRKDLDNVAFAQKFVQDALVKSGILQGDGQKHVVGFTHDFEVARQVGVSVEIMEVVT